jgi:molybdopterin-guanine dinucleotide biosynthesis protein A
MQVGGILLCGGKSSRMGFPKALLPFGEETMLERMVRILTGTVSPIVVVAAADQALPASLESSNVILARDEHPERGPLEGLRAGLKPLGGKAEAAYATSCDAPLLLPQFIRRMIDELGDAQIAVPVEESEGRTFHHPLAAVYRLDVLPQVETLLATDQLRMAGMFDRVSTKLVPVENLRSCDPDLRSLRNLNSPADYAAALKLAGITL